MLSLMTRLLLIILAFAAQDAKPDTIADIHKDIEYQKIGNVALKLDLCQPKDRPKAAMPVIRRRTEACAVKNLRMES
jgi:hypothetical protein